MCQYPIRILSLGILENPTVSELGFHYMLSTGIIWYPKPRILSLGILENPTVSLVGFYYMLSTGILEYLQVGFHYMLISPGILSLGFWVLVSYRILLYLEWDSTIWSQSVSPGILGLGYLVLVSCRIRQNTVWDITTPPCNAVCWYVLVYQEQASSILEYPI